jgi:hypothetical protein
MIKTTLTGAIPVVLFILSMIYVPNLVLALVLITAILGVCFVIGTIIRGEVIR